MEGDGVREMLGDDPDSVFRKNAEQFFEKLPNLSLSEIFSFFPETWSNKVEPHNFDPDFNRENLVESMVQTCWDNYGDLGLDRLAHEMVFFQNDVVRRYVDELCHGWHDPDMLCASIG